MKKQVVAGDIYADTEAVKSKEHYSYTVTDKLKTYQNTADGTSTNYTYNVTGMRKSKTVDGTTTGYIWNGSNMVAETNGGNIIQNQYHYSVDGITSANINGTELYYLKDGHGNVMRTVTPDGTPDNYYIYDAFGNVLEKDYDDVNPFGYCGEYLDNESGLVYLRNRYYDTTTGQFITEDPIKDGLNWYSYCGGNPIMFVDPSGYLRAGYTDEEGVYHADPDAEEFGADSIAYSSLCTLTQMWEDRPNDRASIAKLANFVRETARNEYYETGMSIVLYMAPESANDTDLVVAASDLSDTYLNWVCSSTAEDKMEELYSNYSDGSQANAFKHTMWNALLVKQLGEEKAKLIADAHEFGAKENCTQTSKQQDLMNMDLWNNAVGREMGANFKKSSVWANYNDELADAIVVKINSGGCWVVEWTN